MTMLLDDEEHGLVDTDEADAVVEEYVDATSDVESRAPLGLLGEAAAREERLVIREIGEHTAVLFDAKHSRVIVSDTQRNRLQIYNKVKNYTTAARTI